MKTLTKSSPVSHRAAAPRATVALPYRADPAPAGEAPQITAARTAQEKEINDRFPTLVSAPAATRVAPAAPVVGAPRLAKRAA